MFVKLAQSKLPTWSRTFSHCQTGPWKVWELSKNPCNSKIATKKRPWRRSCFPQEYSFWNLVLSCFPYFQVCWRGTIWFTRHPGVSFPGLFHGNHLATQKTDLEVSYPAGEQASESGQWLVASLYQQRVLVISPNGDTCICTSKASALLSRDWNLLCLKKRAFCPPREVFYTRFPLKETCWGTSREYPPVQGVSYPPWGQGQLGGLSQFTSASLAGNGREVRSSRTQNWKVSAASSRNLTGNGLELRTKKWCPPPGLRTSLSSHMDCRGPFSLLAALYSHTN